MYSLLNKIGKFCKDRFNERAEYLFVNSDFLFSMITVITSVKNEGHRIFYCQFLQGKIDCND